MADIKTYRIATICENCGYTPIAPCLGVGDAGLNYIVVTEIPKGTTVKDFLKNKKCKNCGCKGVTIRKVGSNGA